MNTKIDLPVAKTYGDYQVSSVKHSEGNTVVKNGIVIIHKQNKVCYVSLVRWKTILSLVQVSGSLKVNEIPEAIACQYFWELKYENRF
jgi:hypothetical protein